MVVTSAFLIVVALLVLLLLATGNLNVRQAAAVLAVALILWMLTGGRFDRL